jgi:metal-responsive CopG/Arc/MetJ family transcriptional regulator
MSVAKIAITLDETVVHRIDRLVREHVFPNRSKAVQEAVAEKIQRIDRHRLARECLKLDPKTEQAMADEGLRTEAKEWPEY